MIAIKTTVFGDILFIINFSMDFLSLYISGRILHLDTKKKPLILASAIGGVYGVLSLFIKGAFPSVILNIAIYILMCLTAYRHIVFSQLVKLCVMFYAVSLLMGGAVTYSYSLIDRIISDIPITAAQTPVKQMPFHVFALIVAICGIASYITGKIFTRSKDVKDAYMTAEFNGKRIDLHVLVDSGNLLHEPLSGYPVILIKKDKFNKLTGCGEDDLLENETIIPSLRCIPAHTAGGDIMLYGVVADKVLVGTKKDKAPFKAVIALCKDDIAEFDGIVPLCLYEVTPSKSQIQ